MKTAYLFSGQGSQYIGMEKIFKNHHQDILASFFESANKILGYNIYDIVANGPAEKLNNTKYTQPAIFIISSIAYEILKKKESRPDFCAGHSVGEITSLYASGALPFKDALLFIQKRAQAMEHASTINPGAMLALIKPSDDDIKNIITNTHSISIANINSTTQTILSGPLEGIKNAISFCKENKIKAIPLPVSGAFHSILMKPASDSLLKIINQLNLSDSMMPIYQNINALPENRKEFLKENLAKQITSTVQWKDTINNMIKDKANCFIEVGPKQILTNLIKKSHPNVTCKSFEDIIKNE